MSFISGCKACDLASQIRFGRLCVGPIDPGVWSLLEPVGVQNHAPQLSWLSSDRLACVWMAGGQEGTAGMQIVQSVLQRGKSSWSRPVVISKDEKRSEKNPLLFVLDRSGHRSCN